MKTKLMISILVLTILISSVTTASMLIPANDRAKERAKAPEHSPVISDNWGLERVDFIHYVKPPWAGKPKAEKCYKLLGVKWKSFPVNYVINPYNLNGLSEEFVTNAIATSAETWDQATTAELLNDVYSVDYTAQYGVQNFENVIVFDDYPDDNVIGVTSIWFYRKGKQIAEFDIMLNTRFDWGDVAVDPAVMDLQNIATHELGHGVGLDDIYSSACSHVTMYGYSSYGETQKRTLEQPDIAGLQDMYN